MPRKTDVLQYAQSSLRRLQCCLCQGNLAVVARYGCQSLWSRRWCEQHGNGRLQAHHAPLSNRYQHTRQEGLRDAE
jgi:hypothetical protein